jgi:hypothetical protein
MVSGSGGKTLQSCLCRGFWARIVKNSDYTPARRARFFLVKHTKTGKNVYQMTSRIPNGHKNIQMALTQNCITIIQSKALQNIPKFGIFGMKIYHLAARGLRILLSSDFL